MTLKLATLLALSGGLASAQTCINRIDSPYPSEGFSSVEIDGDRLIAGHPFADLAEDNEGAVSIYHRNAATGVFELQTLLEPGLGAQAEFGRDVALEGDVAVVLADGSEQALVYEWTGSEWSHAVTITSALSDPNLWSVATNGTEAFVVAAGVTLVWRKQGGTWQEVQQLSSGSRRSIAVTDEFVATGGQIYREDAIFGFIHHGSYGLINFASWKSIAFDPEGGLHGFVGFSGDVHQHVRIPVSSGGSGGSVSAINFQEPPFPQIAASERGLFILGRNWLGNSDEGLHWWRDLNPQVFPYDFRRFFEASPELGVSADGSLLAFAYAGRLEVHDLDCLGISEPDCSQTAANSTGQTGTLIASGSPAVAQNSFALTAEALPSNSFGFFLASQGNLVTPNAGGSKGNLCLSGNIGRFVGPGQIQNSGAGGSISLTVDLNAMPSPTGFVSVMPGDTWYFQLWHRDANPTLESNFTDSAKVAFE